MKKRGGVRHYLFYKGSKLVLILGVLLIGWLLGCSSESSSPGSTAKKPPQDSATLTLQPSLKDGSAHMSKSEPEALVEKQIASRPQTAASMEDPNEIVLPPEEAGGTALTRRERDRLVKAQSPADLGNEIASITVDPKSGQGLTWKELEQILAQDEQNLDQEVASVTLEANDPNIRGMTWKEFKAILEREKEADLDDMESSFKDEAGNPLTYRELERR